MPRVPDVGNPRVELVVVAGMMPKTKFPILIWLFAVALGKRMLFPIPILFPAEVRLPDPILMIEPRIMFP